MNYVGTNVVHMGMESLGTLLARTTTDKGSSQLLKHLVKSNLSLVTSLRAPSDAAWPDKLHQHMYIYVHAIFTLLLMALIFVNFTIKMAFAE